MISQDLFILQLKKEETVDINRLFLIFISVKSIKLFQRERTHTNTKKYLKTFSGMLK